MSVYHPPVQDMLFVLKTVLGFRSDSTDEETLSAILEEAGKLAKDVLAPLNFQGDRSGTKFADGVVKTAPGFQDAYKRYREGGWNSVPFPPEYGGQGLPWAVAFPVQEMWQAANMAFGLCPLLNQGAVEAIAAHGSEELKAYYLPKLIEGQWTGTMNLTEPQAGSDLGLLRARAEKQSDGTYKISGQKIYITYGEHDLAENIIHLVLARTTDAPEDVKGISLFIVPKYLRDGARNDVKCTGIEHKLGIHASPTCTMQFGDNGGATGYLIGQEHQGLKYMFTMMNNARLSVGLQGVAIGEAAYQKALHYAQERIQGKSFTSGERTAIAHHPDVRRMLLSMKSQVQAGRLLAYEAALGLDASHGGDEQSRLKVDLLTPIVKAWCTDMACAVSSLGVQIHGGMGFVEETGAAQHYRDARILPIYEGTNGIQAADLVFRKILRDGGVFALSYIDHLESIVSKAHTAHLSDLLNDLRQVTQWLTQEGEKKNMDLIAAAASPYLTAFGLIAGGAMLSLSYDKALQVSDKIFVKDQCKTAQFFVTNILPLAGAHLKIACEGAMDV